MIYFSYAFLIYCVYGHFGQISGCPTYCVRCDDNSQQCQECMTGYFIDNNKQCSQCPERCSECSSSTKCTKCKPNHWNNNCYERCDQSCDKSGCDDTNGNCYKCPIGFYGAFCEQNCNLCKNQLCGLRECSEECINGYYKDILALSSYCQQCPTGCAICKSYSFCLECKKGFYKFTNNNSDEIFATACYSCRSNCEECSGHTECTVCKPGTYGKSCEKKCGISNCNRCIESRGIAACLTCDNGFKHYDNKCIKCDSNDGLCLRKCRGGFWGKYCDQACPVGCSICNKTNGICDFCYRDKYGENCQFTCSEYCMDDGIIITICNIDSGKCELGCKDGYSGDRCLLVQPTPSSEFMTTTTKTVPNSEDDRTAYFFIGLASGIGICLIIGTAIGLLYFKVISQKNNSTKSKDRDQREYVNTVGMIVIASPETDTNTEDNANNRATDQTSQNVYERLETSVREEENDYTGLE